MPKSKPGKARVSKPVAKKPQKLRKPPAVGARTPSSAAVALRGSRGGKAKPKPRPPAAPRRLPGPKPSGKRRAPNRIYDHIISQYSGDRSSLIADPGGHLIPEVALQGKCKVCRLAATDPDAWNTINIHLLGGGAVMPLFVWLQHNGHPDISTNNLTKHAKGHLTQWAQNTIRYRIAAETWASITKDSLPDELSVAVLKQNSILLQMVLSSLQIGEQGDEQSILQRAKDPFVMDLLGEQRRNAAALAQAERARSQNRRDQRDLQLKEMLVAEKRSDYLAGAEATFRRVIERLTPNSRAELEAALAAEAGADKDTLDVA